MSRITTFALAVALLATATVSTTAAAQDFAGARAQSALLRLENRYPNPINVTLPDGRSFVIEPGGTIATTAITPGPMTLKASTLDGRTLQRTQLEVKAEDVTSFVFGAGQPMAGEAAFELVNDSGDAVRVCFSPVLCRVVEDSSFVRFEGLRAGARTIELLTEDGVRSLDSITVDLMPGDTYRWNVTPDVLAEPPEPVAVR